MAQTIRELIEARLTTLGLSQTELCKRAQVSRQTLHALMSEGEKLPTLQTVVAVSGVIQIHPIRLLQLLCDTLPVQGGKTRVRHRRGDMSAFAGDRSFPDGTPVLLGQRFTKTWALHNVGTVPWEGRYLQCMDEELVVFSRTGETMRLAQNLRPVSTRVAVPLTPPGSLVEISADFIAPDAPGTVLSYWKLVHADGSLCFPAARGVWVKVVVTSLAAAGQNFEH